MTSTSWGNSQFRASHITVIINLLQATESREIGIFLKQTKFLSRLVIIDLLLDANAMVS